MKWRKLRYIFPRHENTFNQSTLVTRHRFYIGCYKSHFNLPIDFVVQKKNGNILWFRVQFPWLNLIRFTFKVHMIFARIIFLGTHILSPPPLSLVDTHTQIRCIPDFMHRMHGTPFICMLHSKQINTCAHVSVIVCVLCISVVKDALRSHMQQNCLK